MVLAVFQAKYGSRLSQPRKREIRPRRFIYIARIFSDRLCGARHSEISALATVNTD